MFSRIAENDVLQLLGEFPAVGIIGPRQVGKTTLAKQVASHLKEEPLYLDLELPEDVARLQQPSLFLKNYQSRCVIVDEVQRMPELFPVLRSLIDQHRKPGRFILLGSASPQLIRNSSESLAGRIAYKELTPLNWLEVSSAIAREQHWVRGGFPDALLAKNDASGSRWQKNFIQTYIEKDLPLLGLQTDLNRLRDFVWMVASAQGQLWKAESFGKALGVTAPVIKRYLHYLENAFLVEVVRPFHINIKKRLVKSPKVYIRDTGMLHSLTGISSFEELQRHVSIGHSWETYAIAQIKSVLPENWSLNFYRTHEGAEADVVLAKGNRPEITAEIKYSNAPKVTKGLIHVTQDLRTKANYIITPSSDRYPVSENIETISLDAFLRELASKKAG